MMRTTSILLALCSIINAAHASSSIYGSIFDYRKAKPTSEYFPGKTTKQIILYCKNERLDTMDLAACAQSRYEAATIQLDQKFVEIEDITRLNDRKLLTDNEPEALPYFQKAQSNWRLYRDNECYAEAYQSGTATLRYIDFWDCMTRITKNRLNELTTHNIDRQ
ncbi:MAG: DUF1311 domain-containing protein [Burkholderiales bacterium]|nr:DUF1311 domain-containing protein [Burkholderiales bacterium]